MRPDVLQPDSPEAALRAWDWRAALEARERSLGWLGRHTDRAASTVSRYALGTLPTPVEWLREVARVLGREAAA